MKLSRFCAVTVALTAGVDALAVQKRDVPGTVSFPLLVNEAALAGASVNSLRKRAGEVETADTNRNLLYTIQLELGTPPQLTNVQVDTGSSDLVVETPSSDICSAGVPNPCSNFGACKSSNITHERSQLMPVR
jgi:hypothetical protein